MLAQQQSMVRNKNQNCVAGQIHFGQLFSKIAHKQINTSDGASHLDLFIEKGTLIRCAVVAHQFVLSKNILWQRHVDVGIPMGKLELLFLVVIKRSVHFWVSRFFSHPADAGGVRQIEVDRQTKWLARITFT